MNIIKAIGRLFAIGKESAPINTETETNNNPLTPETDMTQQEISALVSATVAAMLPTITETIVTKLAAQQPIMATAPVPTPMPEPTEEADPIDKVIDEVLEESVPTDQDSIIGGTDVSNPTIDSLVSAITKKSEEVKAASGKWTPTTNTVTICQYSDKSTAVFGDLKDKDSALNLIKSYGEKSAKTGKLKGVMFCRSLSAIEGTPSGWLISNESVTARGGVAVLEAGIKALGMNVVLGNSVVEQQKENKAKWEAEHPKADKPKEQPKAEPIKVATPASIAAVVPEAAAEADRIKAEEKPKRTRKEKPSIDPNAPENKKGEEQPKAEEPKEEPKQPTMVIPIAKGAPKLQGKVLCYESDKKAEQKYKKVERELQYRCGFWYYQAKAAAAVYVLVGQDCETGDSIMANIAMVKGSIDDATPNYDRWSRIAKNGVVESVKNGDLNPTFAHAFCFVDLGNQEAVHEIWTRVA